MTYEDGWQTLPTIPTADLHRDWQISGTNSTLSSGLDPTAVTRAIIVTGGKARDTWSYWIDFRNILSYAASSDPSIDDSTISILGPVFFSDVDITAGAAKSTNQLYWSKTGWFEGTYAEGDAENDKISSFQVIDEMVEHYTDRKVYPNLKTVIFASHSAGAQFVQRYAAMRIPTKDDDMLHFIAANSGSFLWLVEDRPVAADVTCTDVDRYKYGLTTGFPGYSTGDTNKIGREGIVERFRGRNVHYAQGTADEQAGDSSCQANTQGPTHLARGENFIDMLNANGGMPANHTMDWIAGAAHDNPPMYNSTALRTRLFKDATIASSGTRPARRKREPVPRLRYLRKTHELD
ncbi:hypothetical protein D9758_004290 [Tetrapyrgos nigripes]|uniref:Uncharacterized protein n=1 Tax=Tetrapyrgos nigripes TaxID=182062 RepID=A0A8H5GUT9_9AGAR|nr:hypothetical protein D9758_004290 [Tetrapyrgos nigripes]